ncbi:Vitamin B12 import ATP-binding protein BtuD [compost metagenome]
MTDDKVLQVENISKQFPGVWALRNVTFDVISGEVHGLVGENGAGKSTLMAVASGALAPDEGRVAINGAEVSGNPKGIRAARLAIVRQEPALMPDLSVAENIYLSVSDEERPAVGDAVAWAQALLEDWDKDTSIRAADRVDLMNAQQRFVVEIVKALAAKPKVLILDEPTEHLTSDDVERLFEKIRDLSRKGVGIVYISHRIREVRAISNRVTVLREGRSQGSFPIEELDERKIVELIVGKAIEHEFPSKIYAGPTTQEVIGVTDFSGQGFANVSLSIRRGEIVGLAGMDGHGKREFVAALSGLAPGRGQMRVDGKNIDAGSAVRASKAGISFLSGSRHKDGMFAELSVRDNFSYRMLNTFARGGIIDARAEASATVRAVREYEIRTTSIATPIGTLSGGNQQKVLIAGVLTNNPKVVVIDEPTQGVDIGARVFIYQAIVEAASRGTSFIVVSSDASELAGLCHRVAVFSRGQIAEVIAEPAVTENEIIKSVLTSGSTRNRPDSDIGFADLIAKWLAGHWAPVATVASIITLLAVYASISNEFFLTPRNIAGMLILVAALAVVSFGQQLLMLVGGIDLSVGPLMGLTTVVMSFYFSEGATVGLNLLGWSFLLLLAISVGTLNWALVDPIGMHPMVATLATFMGLQSAALLLRPTPDGMLDFAFLDAVNSTWTFFPLAALGAAGAALIFESCLFKTVWGIQLRGFGSRADAARMSGISPRQIKLFAYVGCSILAVAAGVIMAGQVGTGDATSGNDYTLASIAAAVVGGASIFGARGSFLGAFLGALLITQVNVVTTFLSLSDAWRSILMGTMIIASVAAYSRARRSVRVI